jgi:hypothetical protein
MKTITKLYIMLAIVVLSSAAINAQSTDIDNPTPMTSTIIEGAGDGKGETIYYSFDASKGDVKVTVDAKTDYYSTPVQVTLLDENSKELLPIYVVAKGAGQREVRTRYFVRDQKVIVRISTRDDNDVKLLNYKVRIEGAVQFATVTAADPAKQAAIEQMQNNTGAAGQPSETAATGQPSETLASGATGQPTESTPAADTGTSTGTETGTKTPLKKKAKAAAKEVLKKIIDN